jgi:hypothetical protein
MGEGRWIIDTSLTCQIAQQSGCVPLSTDCSNSASPLRRRRWQLRDPRGESDGHWCAVCYLVNRRSFDLGGIAAAHEKKVGSGPV